MSTLRSVLTLLAVCAAVVLLSMWGLVSDFLTHLTTNIDGLLLLMICLLMGGLFLLMLFVLAKEGGLLPERHKRPVPPSAAAKPAEGKS